MGAWFFCLYDLETAVAVYRNRISPDPIFLTAQSSSTSGFYAINRRGQGRTTVGVTEEICQKRCYFEQLKEVLRNGWQRIPEKGIILETTTKSAVMTVWGAGVLAVTNAPERLGLIDTGLSNIVHMKEHIAAVVKAENEKTIQQLKSQHAEDKALLNKHSKEFEAHRALTKMWVAHLIEKTLEPLSREEFSKIQGAFALLDKAEDGFITQEEAMTVLEMFGEKMSEAELNKLLVKSGRIFVDDFLELIVEKAMEVRSSKLKAKKVTQEEVRAEETSSP